MSTKYWEPKPLVSECANAFITHSNRPTEIDRETLDYYVSINMLRKNGDYYFCPGERPTPPEELPNDE